MSSQSIQKFIGAVLQAAGKRCGPEFLRHIQYLRLERERLLNHNWKTKSQDSPNDREQRLVYRQIDFDTIVLQAPKFINSKEYPALLFEIAQKADQFGEADKAVLLLNRIITKYMDQSEVLLRARSHKLLGDIHINQNHFRIAGNQYEASLELFRELDDVRGMTSVTNSRGVLQVESGNPEKGLNLFEEAHELCLKHQFDELLIDVLYNLGNANHILGNYDQAMQWYEQALKWVSDANLPDAQAAIFHNIGIVHKSRERYFKAQEFFQKSYDLLEKTGNAYLKGLSNLEQAEVACMVGEFSTSMAQATASFQIFTQLGDRLSIADVYRIFGMIHRETRKFDLALSYFENSLRLNQELDNHLNLGETHFELGHYYRLLDDPSHMKKNWQEAVQHFKALGAHAKIQLVQKQLKKYSS